MSAPVPPRVLFARAMATFDAALRQAPGFSAPTPCAGWTVRDLINHVVGEDRWAVELLGGRTVAEVGNELDGDLLGDDPIAAWSAAGVAAADAVDKAADGDLVALSAGPTPVAEYLRQLAADHLIHAWDLGGLRLDDDLVRAVTEWFAGEEDTYRAYGMVGPRPGGLDDLEPQARLLAMFGRSEALAAVERFGAAFAARDIDAVMAAMTSDCVFESTAPPDGERFVGRAAVRSAWEKLFAAPGEQTFTTESQFAAGNRAVVQWRYDFTGGHVRGIDVFRIRAGLVAEKFSYVKG